MLTIRTPDDRFEQLPEFPFEPNYASIDDTEGGSLRVHYLDEGPRDGAPVLLLHGEPTWSFLYRKMIPPLVAAGHRVIVPDLVGFGRSDKPIEVDDHTYARHVAWMSALVFEQLDLSAITFFGQDWGGLIGLRMVAAEPERFARVMVANTGLPTGDRAPTDAFLAWQQYARKTPELPIGRIIAGGCRNGLDEAVIAAYDAPFPYPSYTAGARALPSLVPTSPDDPAAADNRAAWEVLRRYGRPLLCAFSDSDPITAGGERAFLGVVPGTADQPATTITDAGHFLQEDQGPLVAAEMLEFIERTPDAPNRPWEA